MSISTDVTALVPREHGRSWTLASGIGPATRRPATDGDAAPLTSIHPTLVTVTANVDSDGGFVFAHARGEPTVGGGVELAATLSAYPLYGADLRMVLAWPRHPDAHPSLHRNVRELAEVTGAVVWTPPEGGRAEFVAVCRDLAAVDAFGEIAAWEPQYPDRPETPRYFSDADGRLVPACGPVVTSRPSVSLISVPAKRSQLMARRYADVPHRRDTFFVDLTVLEDGRLAACCEHGTTFAVGPRQLSQLLGSHGWRGEQIVLLADVGPEQEMALGRYLTDVGAALGHDLSMVWFPASTTVLDLDGTGRRPAYPDGPAATAPSPVAAEDPAERLASLVEDIFAEVPTLQCRCRNSIADDPRAALGVVHAWYRLHRELTYAGTRRRCVRSGRVSLLHWRTWKTRACERRRSVRPTPPSSGSWRRPCR